MHLNLFTINKDNDKETKIHMLIILLLRWLFPQKTKYTLIYREYWKKKKENLYKY